jgi:hypothetical protein
LLETLDSEVVVFEECCELVTVVEGDLEVNPLAEELVGVVVTDPGVHRDEERRTVPKDSPELTERVRKLRAREMDQRVERDESTEVLIAERRASQVGDRERRVRVQTLGDSGHLGCQVDTADVDAVLGHVPADMAGTAADIEHEPRRPTAGERVEQGAVERLSFELVDERRRVRRRRPVVRRPEVMRVRHDPVSQSEAMSAYDDFG